MTDRRSGDAPVFIADVHLDLSRPLADLSAPEQYAWALAIVRVHHTPVGMLSVPIHNRVIPRRRLIEAIADRLAEPTLHTLLCGCLLNRGLAGPDSLEALLDVPPAVNSGPWPTVTAAVCTRGRPDDLCRCLTALTTVAYPSFDIIVIDNAPRDSTVADLVRDRFPRARYISEPRPGLDWARNRAILEATGDIIAFTDDDAVADERWLQALVAPMIEDAAVAATAGLVLPDELETPAQQLFESHGGLGRGYARRWVRVPRDTKTTHVANPTTFGTGANMAFRRALFDAIGGFDPALDAGTRSAAGGDTEMFFRVLKAGHTIAYEPAAIVRHRHRRDYTAARAQLANWLIGVHAAFESLSRTFPDERRALAGFAARLLLLYYPRRLAMAAIGSSLSTGLVLSELRGALGARGRYEEACAAARRIAEQSGGEPTLPPLRGPAPRSDARRTRPARRVAVDVEAVLPSLLPGPDDAERVYVDVMRASRAIGTVEIAAGGAPVTRRRLAEAIVAEHLHALADVRRFRDVLRRRLIG